MMHADSKSVTCLIMIKDILNCIQSEVSKLKGSLLADENVRVIVIIECSSIV